MALTGEYGNMSDEEIERLGWATHPDWPDQIEHEPGCTEPWVSRLVADFVIANGARYVLETGSFKGATSVYLLEALKKLGGGILQVCDIDGPRCAATMRRLLAVEDQDKVAVFSHPGDILHFLRTAAGTWDLAFVDDCHEKKHVRLELQLLYPKMNPGGLILLHDVYGSCDLKTVVQEYGGYSIDLPRLGPAGGLGIIQVPR